MKAGHKKAALLATSLMVSVWSQGSSAANCLVSDVTFAVSGSGLAQADADACVGPASGNDSWSDPNSSLDTFGGTGSWYSLSKFDFDTSQYANGSAVEIWSGGSEVGSIAFSLSNLGTTTIGSEDYNIFDLNWVYTAIDSFDLSFIPITMDFNFVIGQGSGFSQYYFDGDTDNNNDGIKDRLLLADQNLEGVGAGSFQVFFKCTGGPNGTCGENSSDIAYSHLSVYGRNPVPNEDDSDKPDITIPEPGALALLGIGLLGMAASRKAKTA